MAWHEIERQTIGRITVIVYRCGGCKRPATASKDRNSESTPTPSACVFCGSDEPRRDVQKKRRR